MKGKRSLIHILLVPMLLLVLLLGILPFLMLLTSGIRTTMENSFAEIDSNTVEFRRVVLENDMINEWGEVKYEADLLNSALESFLKEQSADMMRFLSEKELQNRFLEQVFPEIIDMLQRKKVSGAFVILANTESIRKPGYYNGFFLRDSEPTSKALTNTDLLLEKGSKNLGHSWSITLDSAWATSFQLAGSGVRKSDDFFYVPYETALQHTDTDMVNLGYWSMPFVLEDNEIDNHSMITYSLPLLCNGTVYGVLGTEISVSYLSRYLPVRDLDKELNAGYVLAYERDDGSYAKIEGTGAMADAACRDNGVFSLEQTSVQDLYRLKHVSVGSQEIYAVCSELTLYGNHVPYENTRWVLCGFVPENQIFGLGQNLFRRILTTILACAVLGLAFVILAVRHVTRPVYRLMDSIRGGVEGLGRFKGSDIYEVDELYQVVKNLTENEKQTASLLLEEKEKYRVAVENSTDIFFTYRAYEKSMEIVNGEELAGVWRCGDSSGFCSRIHPEDLSVLQELMEGEQEQISGEIRIRRTETSEYTWNAVIGNRVCGSDGKDVRVIGCLRDIDKTKKKELSRKRHQLMDPVTSFYRMEHGLQVIETARKDTPEGILAVFEMEEFSSITEKYGFTFGDVLLEEAAAIIRREGDDAFQNAVYVRAGESEILVWAPAVSYEAIRTFIKQARRETAALIKPETLRIDIRAGEAEADASVTLQLLIGAAWHHMKTGERLQKGHGAEYCFSRIISAGYLDKMSLSSLTLNLFDRNDAMDASLDLLSLRMQRLFGMDNLLITSFCAEYMSNHLEYSWKRIPNWNENGMFHHCTEAEYRRFAHQAAQKSVEPMNDGFLSFSMLRQLGLTEKGILFHMMDNARYSGTIILLGTDPQVLSDSEKRKQIREICTIIQNRLNQQRHDQTAQAKSDFLARMSHEIRTPMNGIIGMTEIALREGQSEERRIDCLRKVKSASNYLLGLLNDILDMSKIESGKMQIVENPFDLQKLLKSLEPVLAAKLAEKNLDYKTDIYLTGSWYVGDELRLNQVLINLLGNAVKYTDEGGRIVLTVHEQKTSGGIPEIYFAVSDNGIGIDSKNQERIFRSFEQVDDETSRSQGTGLGLAISAKLVQMMGGEIMLDSAVGVGSTFSFLLQLQPAQMPKQQETAMPDSEAFAGARILNVEDNPLNMEIIRTILEDFGIAADEAHDGEEAVEMFHKAPEGYYDMIFMDIMMPKMNGYEATYAIRTARRSDSKTIPIIAMSANAFDEDVRHSIESGMNGHLSKPIDLEKLKMVLRKYL